MSKKNISFNGDPNSKVKTPIRGKKKGVGSPHSQDIRRFLSGGTNTKIEAIRAKFTPLVGKIVVEKQGNIAMTSQGGGQEVSQGIKLII